MKIKTLHNKRRLLILQLLGWGIILATSLFWSVGSGTRVTDFFGLTLFAVNILTLLTIYIVNYFIFIPRYLFTGNRHRFFIANILLLISLLAVSFTINSSGFLESLRPMYRLRKPDPDLMFLARDLINYILMIGLVTALRLAERLQMSEAALREAENARVKAELDNLRSQINPHFLLNTLNNIYALTAIDTEKAQNTIKELSNLLRYILYDNLNDRVFLTREVEFVKTYIELMSIRLPRKVRLHTQFDLSVDCTTQVAPLIFISLIENAFKHSVSASGEGFIDIRFEDRTDSSEVVLAISNSNHAKADQDKSGHGIGLEQVRRRLELLYPGSYSWEVEQSEEVYSSILILKRIEL